MEGQRIRWIALGFIVAGSMGLVAYVHNVIIIEERLRQLAALRRTCDSLEGVLAARRQTLARLEAPERIVPAAQRLGLEIATAVRYTVPASP